jgi:hypothetical protein
MPLALLLLKHNIHVERNPMERRRFIQLGAVALLGAAGCRGKQHAHILKEDDENMVGSHEAGASVYEPLVEGAVARLLGKEMVGIQQVALNEGTVQPKRICFVGIENMSAEELGDFKEHLYQIINQKILESNAYDSISKRYMQVGLREAGLRPDSLFLPSNRKAFITVMEAQGQPIDYLLYAKLTSGTTRSNNTSSQRDYRLTLNLININNGRETVESQQIRKGYHKSVFGRVKHY